MKGGNFLFSEKSLIAEKTERGDPLGFSNIHSVAKQQKIEVGPFGGKIFSEKSLTVPKKNWKGGPLGFSNIHSVTKPKKIEGGPLGKKFSGKKLEWGTLWSRRLWYVTPENRKNVFGSVR